MIISQTPFRISFFGGGTDFPEFYNERGGSVLLTTIDRFAYLLIHHLSPLYPYRFKANYARTETVLRPEDFEHPLVRECLKLTGIEEGLEISHISDLPARTGLGSSSSFTVGLLNALYTFKGTEASPEDLAREAVVIERERVGDPGGHQDQYAAAFGGLIRINFGKDHPPEVLALDVSAARRKALQDHLLLFYTGIEQSAEAILQEQCGRVKRNAASLAEMLRMVDDAEILLCGSEPIVSFGELLHESWMRKRGLAEGISNSLVDEAYEAGRAAGAAGGKLLGAGGRGFLLFVAEPSIHGAIRQRLKDLPGVEFAFCESGSKVIFQSDE